MKGHGQTAPIGVVDRQADSTCHIPLQSRGTQLALYQELAGPEGIMAAFSGACTTPMVMCQG